MGANGRLFQAAGAAAAMAGLIGLTSSDIEIQDALRTQRWEYASDWIPHPVVRLTTTLPVAVNRAEGVTIVQARWGFEVGAGRPIGNARDDRLQESRLWSSMLSKSPCLIASTGIYEMIKKPEKTSYWFRRQDQKPIVMPGLAGERNIKGEKRLCAAIITTEPNKFFGQFHNRQVCALATKELDAWMSAEEPAEAMQLLHPPAEKDWEAVPVEDRIFKHGRIEMDDLVPTGPPVRWKA
jgi:putative SOS response-associated peptidase YedK